MSVRLALALILVLQTSAQAQTHPPPENHATLAEWQHDVSIALRDRRHAYGGLFFDRGVYRRLTPAMDHEYDMDLLTYGFTPAEDARWYASDHAVRTYMGSIHKSRFATRTRFRNRVNLAGRHEVLLDAMQQEDLSAQRFFIDFRYGYRLSDRHRIGFSQTIAAYKPDLDFTLFHTYSSRSAGRINLDLGLLDVANNLIFDTLGADPALEDTVRTYSRKPYLLAASWESPLYHGFRAEILAGLQPRTRARVRSQGATDLDFRWQENARYAGVQLEYGRRWVTVGAQLRVSQGGMARWRDGTIADDELERSAINVAESARHEQRADRGLPWSDRAIPPSRHSALPQSRRGFSSTQRSTAFTTYALAPVGPLAASLWLTLEHYRDRQRGDDFSASSVSDALDYRERRLTLHVRLERVPTRGLRAGADYFLDHRTFVRDAVLMNRYLMFLPWSPNGRFALHVGYQFSPQAYLLIGAAYDAGGDPFYDDDRGLVRYDGGFGRLAVMW